MYLGGLFVVIGIDNNYKELQMNNLPQVPTILTIDDDEDLLMLLQLKLKKIGYQVKKSPNAANVLDMIYTSPPDIILLDLSMNGVDGATICGLLKSNESTAKIPVVLFSANEDLALTSQKCGADGYVCKPYNSQMMENELARVLNRAA